MGWRTEQFILHAIEWYRRLVGSYTLFLFSKWLVRARCSRYSSCPLSLSSVAFWLEYLIGHQHRLANRIPGLNTQQRTTKTRLQSCLRNWENPRKASYNITEWLSATMIAATRRWFRRNRTPIAVGVGLVGAGYLATQYIIGKINDARERMSSDRIAKEK